MIADAHVVDANIALVADEKNDPRFGDIEHGSRGGKFRAAIEARGHFVSAKLNLNMMPASVVGRRGLVGESLDAVV